VASVELLKTAGPFVVGWLAAAPLTGAFSAAACGDDVPAAVGAAAKNWALGIPTVSLSLSRSRSLSLSRAHTHTYKRGDGRPVCGKQWRDTG